MGVCDDGLLELVLFFGVRFSMNTTISTSNNMIDASPGSGRVPGLDRHHGSQHREAFRPRQCPVVLPPVRGTAPDALAVGEIPARAAGPVHPVGSEIEPGL